MSNDKKKKIDFFNLTAGIFGGAALLLTIGLLVKCQPTSQYVPADIEITKVEDHTYQGTLCRPGDSIKLFVDNKSATPVE
jgi:hypothetical protein